MVKINKILDFLCSFAPLEYAESYDNPGLLVGDGQKDATKVLVTLDVDENVVKDAADKGCELIISHHPLIFKPLDKILADDAVSRTIIKLIKEDITLISMHTNFDSVQSGLCDLFLDKIANTKNRASLQGDIVNGCGRFAELKRAETLNEMLNNIKSTFSLKNLRYIGDKEKKINKIAVCCGGGAEFIYDAKRLGADVFISGDIKYHQARFAYENEIAFVEIPHYNSEIIFCDYMKDLLEKEFKKSIDIYVTDKNIDIFKNI